MEVIVGVSVGPGSGVRSCLRRERLSVFGPGRRQHSFEIRLSLGLENGLVRRIEEVDDARAQVIEPPGQAGMDGGRK